ncbi:MAG: sodium:solute symporter family protein [Clostridiales bacterium]|nr:sodium:solute symporter family protein [Clostridiales bacterium]
MKIGIIIGVLIYEIIVVFGIGAIVAWRNKKHAHNEGEFALGGRNMTFAMLVPTIALTGLGSAHITGMFEMAYGMGAVTIWFSIAHVLFFILLCLLTGPWIRRMGHTTISAALKDMYGEKVSLAVSCVMAGVVFGILTLETQGAGIVIEAMTGWPIVPAVIAGGIFGVVYVILAGMKEIGVVNLVNIFVLYVGIIAATIIVATQLPGGDYGYVTEALNSDVNTAFMTKVMGTPQLWFSFALSNLLVVAFYGPVSQQQLQTPIAAKNEKIIRRSLWIAAPINGLFGVFSVTLGLAARALPEYAALGGKTAAMNMLVDMLPPWVTVLTLAALLAAILSTFAMTTLVCATIFGYDIYKNLFKPQATEKEVKKVMRIVIIILAVFVILLSFTLPTIIGAINWAFAWICPVFFLFVFGLFWKRSAKVAGFTLGISWVVNALWSLTPLPTVFGTTADIVPNGYITSVLGFVIPLIGNCIVKDAKMGYWKEKGLKNKEVK